MNEYNRRDRAQIIDFILSSHCSGEAGLQPGWHFSAQDHSGKDSWDVITSGGWQYFTSS